MMRKLAFSLMLVVPLLAVQRAEAYHQEVRLEKATLPEVQATLFGQPMKPGLIVAGRPFKAHFEDVVVTRQDAWHLVRTVRDAAHFPADSQFRIQGSIDGESFGVMMESNKEGRKVARLEGLSFNDRQEALQLLDTLRGNGVQDVKLEGFVGRQRIAGRIDHGETRLEAN